MLRPAQSPSSVGSAIQHFAKSVYTTGHREELVVLFQSLYEALLSNRGRDVRTDSCCRCANNDFRQQPDRERWRRVRNRRQWHSPGSHCAWVVANRLWDRHTYAVGTVTFTITLTETIKQNVATVVTQSYPLPFAFVVTGYSDPSVTINPSGPGFNLTQNAAAETQLVTIANHSYQAMKFSASATRSPAGIG